jgi:hypothetical protein
MKTQLFKLPLSLSKLSLTICLALLLCLSLSSCEADDEGSSVSCEDELIELAQIMNSKTTLFSQNPTPSSCAALKQAALNLIDRAQACGYEEQYGPLTASWEQIDCSEFN